MYYLAAAQRRLYWHKDKLRRFQEKRLRSVVNYAYRFVPFYHEKFKEADILPSEVKTLEDLSKLPIVKKDVVRVEDPRQLISVQFEPRKLKVVRTSGSTGKPFRVYLTSAEDDWRKAIYIWHPNFSIWLNNNNKFINDGFWRSKSKCPLWLHS
jgi:phenylacetate-CoA ligase